MAADKSQKGQGKGEATAPKNAPSTAPPTGVAAMQAELAKTAKEEKALIQDLVAKRTEALVKRRQFEEARKAELAKTAKENRTTRGVWVVVQQRKNRPVKLRGGLRIPCLTPVKVTHPEVRLLQNKARRGAIQVVVGELEKPGKVLEKAPKKAAGKGV